MLSNADQYLGGSGKIEPELLEALLALGVTVEDTWAR